VNFLGAVNRARQEAAVSGPALTTLGGTLSQESQRFRAWVNEAWREVQTHCLDWDFMRSSFTLSLTADVGTYAKGATSIGADPLRAWDPETFRVYLTSVGLSDETRLLYTPWHVFRNVYQLGAARAVRGRPSMFSIDTSKQLVFYPTPDVSNYTVTGDYMRGVSDLAGDATEIPLDEEFQMLVVWRALRAYALYESAPEVLARATAEVRRLQSKLEAQAAPRMEFGGPLA
jgi:hypothetical protein